MILLRTLPLLLLLCEAMGAARLHQVLLAWQDRVNPTGTSYVVYRGSGTCPPGAWVRLVQVRTKSYRDTVKTGIYCYCVTAVVAGSESVPSTTGQAVAQ